MIRMIHPFSALLAVLLLIGLFACEKEDNGLPPDWHYAPEAVYLDLPESFPILEIPADNPLTAQGIALGRRLYYDPLLHKDGKHACGDCHQQAHAFSSDAAVLPHINLAWNNAFLWDGKVRGSLEDIMLFEVSDFFEADMDQFREHPDYPKLFYEAFGKEMITEHDAARAIAQFVRTLVSVNSRYDAATRPGSDVFFSDEELEGYEIFFSERGDCFHCHGGILFTDNLFHNNALDAQPDPGLGGVTGEPLDIGRFKTPTLRNIAFTAPYMHDGRYQSLKEVIDFYSEGLQPTPNPDPLMKQLHRGGVRLSPEEKENLLAFLLTLTDSTFIQIQAFSDPF